jgi:hypothetical protein
MSQEMTSQASASTADIRDAIAVLDVLWGPKWVFDIDVKRLDMGHPNDCVLGQVGFQATATYKHLIAKITLMWTNPNNKDRIIDIFASNTKGWREAIEHIQGGRNAQS